MNTIDVVVKELKDLRKHLDSNFPSKQDLKNELKDYATKDDLKHFATKDDLRNELRSELKKYATKDDLKKLATKDDIEGVIDYMDDYFARRKGVEQIEKRLSA